MKQLYKIILLLTLTSLAQLASAQALHWLSQPEVDIGLVANNEADDVKISTNGRYITFISTATNLVANDDNNIADIFIRDLQTGITRLASITNANIQVSSGYIKEISAPTSNGRYVAFTSNTSNFPGANGLDFYLYIKDMQTGTLTNASNYNGNSYFEVVLGEIYLSNDGQFVTFTTDDSLDPLHTVSLSQVYQKDLINNTYELLSISHDGLTTAGDSAKLVGVSNNGRYILISTSANNLTTDVINNFGENIFINDRLLNIMTLVNITPTGVSSSDTDFRLDYAKISNSGQVVFVSEQSDLVNNDNNNRDDVFYYDNGTIIRINLDENGDELSLASTSNTVAISGNGNRIAFIEGSDELFPATTNEDNDLYSYETASGTLSLVSATASGNKVNGHSYRPELSNNGNSIVFISNASDLPTDPVLGLYSSVFHYNFNTGVMRNELPAVSAPNTVISDVLNPKISSDQMSVIYSSYSPNLVSEPINDTSLDLFLLDRNTTMHSKINSNTSHYDADISASGHFVSFRSQFLPPDGNTSLGDFYLFLYDRVNNTYTQIEQGGESRVNDDGAVVFTSYENLDINDTNGQKDAYLYNPNTQNITLLSKDLDGNASSAIDIDIGGSGNNIWIIFSSDSDNIVLNDSNSTTDIFLGSVGIGNSSISRITETLQGVESNGRSYKPAISEDSNWIVFLTAATNLTSDGYTSAYSEQIVVFDRINHSFSLVSRNESGLPVTQAGTSSVTSADISDSGRYISYIYRDRDESSGGSFTNKASSIPDFSGDIDFKEDAILFDRLTQTPRLVSKHISGLHTSDTVYHLELTQVVEDLTVFPPLVGVLFAADGGDLTGLSNHPGHQEIYLYQEEISDTGIIFKNSFE